MCITAKKTVFPGNCRPTWHYLPPPHTHTTKILVFQNPLTFRYLQMGAGMMLFITRVRVPMSAATTKRCPSISSPWTHTSMEREARSPHAGMMMSVRTIALPKSKVTKRRAPATVIVYVTKMFIIPKGKQCFSSQCGKKREISSKLKCILLWTYLQLLPHFMQIFWQKGFSK